MVEPAGRWAAGAREAASSQMKSSSSKKQQQQSRRCREEEPESPSYRLALRSIFSCRNSTKEQLGCSSRSKKKQFRCSSAAPSICKDSSRLPTDEEACSKRRASVSSERCVKKPPSEASSSCSKLVVGSCSSSSTTVGGSFRAGMRLRRLSGCYECHMVVDPIIFRDTPMRMCPCPDCGEVFGRQESLQLHQSISHAVSELGPDDTSRNIIEIIFQSSWLKKQSPVCRIERILKVHNTARTLARFEEYRDAVKAKATTNGRCTADGNELLRFHCATMACSLGLHGATHLCCDAACHACAIIRHGFSTADGGGIRTTATSGRAHDAVQRPAADDDGRAMLVCRVIAGRVKRPQQRQLKEGSEEEEDEETSEKFESVAAAAGLYSNMEELRVFNPTAILPCFVVIYKA